jgi:hypothetical protein
MGSRNRCRDGMDEQGAGALSVGDAFNVLITTMII